MSTVKNKWQGGILLDGMIYAIPSNSQNILKIDTSKSLSECESNEYSLIGNLPSTKDKWQGRYANEAWISIIQR